MNKDIENLIACMEIAQRKIYDTVCLPVGMLPQSNNTALERILTSQLYDNYFLQSMKVVESSILPNMPRKIHKKKRWMREAYHSRIQKKWDKRFGKGPMALLINSDYMKLSFPRIEIRP